MNVLPLLSPLLVALLSACSSPPEPKATVSTPPPEPAAAAAPVPRTLLYEVVVSTRQDTRAGLRAFSDGTVQTAQGTAHSTWRTLRTLSVPTVDAIKAELNDPQLGQLPAKLPAPPANPDGSPSTADVPKPDASAFRHGPSARYTFLTKAGERAVSSPSYSQIKVPGFDQVEAVLMRGFVGAVQHVSWTFHHEVPTASEQPCDPMSNSVSRGVAAALLDSKLTPLGLDYVQPEGVHPLVTVDWYSGPRTWRAEFRSDNTVHRIDEAGGTFTAKVGDDVAPNLTTAIARLERNDPSTMCAP